MFTILLLLKAMLKIQFPWLWILIIVFPLLSCAYFLKEKKYLHINALFDREEKKVKKRRKTICVIYMIFSFAIIIAIPFLTSILEH